MPESGMTDYWTRIGLRAVEDFRSVALARLVMRLVGDRTKSIIDVGCGAGTFLALMLREGCCAEGVDVSAEQIRNAHAVLGNLGLSLNAARVGSAGDLEREGRRFGVATLMDVIEHLDEPVQTLATVRNILEPGGRLVVSVPADPSLYDDRDRAFGHRRRYDEATLRAQIEEAGFEIKLVRRWNFLGWLQRYVNTKVLRRKAVHYEFRHSDRLLARMVNRVLRAYFLAVENHVRPPKGMSLIAVACRVRSEKW